MSQIADVAKISRTSIYTSFPTLNAILQVISERASSQSWQFISEYAKGQGCQTLEAALEAIVDGSCLYFNGHPEAMKTILGSNSPYQLLNSVEDFEKRAASIIYSVFEMDWPFVPLSDNDPFRSLGIMQAALYSASVQKHGRITTLHSDQAKVMATTFIKACLQRLLESRPDAPGLTGNHPIDERDGLTRRLAAAVADLGRNAGSNVLDMVCQQIEAVVSFENRRPEMTAGTADQRLSWPTASCAKAGCD